MRFVKNSPIRARSLAFILIAVGALLLVTGCDAPQLLSSHGPKSVHNGHTLSGATSKTGQLELGATATPSPLAQRLLNAAATYLLRDADVSLPIRVLKPLGLSSVEASCGGRVYPSTAPLSSGALEQFQVPAGANRFKTIVSSAFVFENSVDASGFLEFSGLCVSNGSQELPPPAALGRQAKFFYSAATGYPAYAFFWEKGVIVDALVVETSAPDQDGVSTLAGQQAKYLP